MANVLYNVATRKPEAIEEKDLSAALVKGTHAYPVGSIINVVGADGEVRNVESSELQDALEKGYMPETSRQASVREYLALPENKGLSGAAKVGLSQFADEALLSIPETVFDLTADPLDVAKKEALKNEHSIANALGGIGGFGASMFVGGPLFKAAGVAGHAVERGILGGAGELAARGSEEAGAEGVARTAIRGGESVGAEASGVKAGQVSAEAVPEVASRYAPNINPSAGAETVGDAGQNIFERQFHATRGVPQEAERTADQLGRGTRELNAGPSAAGGLGERTSDGLAFPDMEGEVVGNPARLGERTYPRLGEGPSSKLGLPDMEGEVLPNAKQFAPGMPGPAGRESPLNLGTLNMEGRAGISAEALGNQTIDPAEQAFSWARSAGQAAAVGSKDTGLELAAKLSKTDSFVVTADALAKRLVASGVGETEAARMSAGLLRRTIAAAANQGVQAGVIAAPKAITEAMLGNPDDAAEHLLMNMAAGGLLGAGGELAKSGLRSIMPKFSKMAEEQAWRNLMASKNQKAVKQAELIDGGIKGVGRTLLNENLIKNVGEDFTDYATRLNDRKNEVGSRISGLYSELDHANQGVVKLSDTDKLGALFRREVMDPLMKVPGNEGIVSKVQQYVESFERIGEGKNLGFSEMHQWRQGLDDLIWREGAIGITDPAKQQLAKVRHLITKELEEKGNEVSGKLGKSFSEDLHRENLLFRKLKVAADTADHSAVQEISNRAISPSDYITGAAAGIAGGPITGIAGAYIHKKIREDGNSIAARALNYMSPETQAVSGILMAEQAMKKSAEKIDSIPDLIANKLGIRPEALSTIHLSAMSRFIGVTRKEESLSDQYDQVQKHLSTLQNNPEATVRQIADITKHFDTGGAPQIASAVNIKYQQMISSLAGQMPRTALSANSYQSPQVQAAKNMISDGDLNAFARRIAVINDPFIVFKKLGAGTLTLQEVSTMKEFYPALYQKGLEKMTANPVELNYNQRAKLDLYAGQNLTGSQGSAEPPPAPAGKGKKGPKPPDLGVIGKSTAGKKFDIHANNSMTQVQSLFNKPRK